MSAGLSALRRRSPAGWLVPVNLQRRRRGPQPSLPWFQRVPLWRPLPQERGGSRSRLSRRFRLLSKVAAVLDGARFVGPDLSRPLVALAKTIELDQRSSELRIGARRDVLRKRSARRLRPARGLDPLQEPRRRLPAAALGGADDRGDESGLSGPETLIEIRR
jgi:hypothetical protein